MEQERKKEIWVVGDRRNERLFALSLRVLDRARELAERMGGRAALALFGAEPGAEEDLAVRAEQVYLLLHPGLAAPRADLMASALASFIRARGPALVLFALSDFSRELAGRVARLLGAGLIADCHELRSRDGQVLAAGPAWGGEIMAQITFADPSRTGLITVNPHGLKAKEMKAARGRVETVRLEKLEIAPGLRLISSVAEASEHQRLEQAETVVVGGAGVGGAESFHLVRELAAALSGEVGATRPAVLAHWAAEECMIGQTGKTVRPRLLFSLGTSGALQYTAGIRESGTIVAVNRDPAAPIFAAADFGIVGDLKVLLPLLIAKIKRARFAGLADLLEATAKPGAGPAGFGTKVKDLRAARGWTRETLAQATGQTPEFIVQVENDELTPPVSFLLGLARAFQVDPADFLREEQKAAIQDQRTKAFVTRTQNYSYQTLTPGAENERLRAFRITIEPRESHQPVAYKHDGEEFIYVMEGELELTLGHKAHHLKPLESIHFNSNTPHQLKSLSDQPTVCLVVLYTP